MRQILYLFITTLIVLSGCRCNEEELIVEIPNCGNGYEYDEDSESCLCPPGNFEVAGVCRPAAAYNSFSDTKSYFAVAEDCPCLDTVMFQFVQPGWASSLNGEVVHEANIYNTYHSNPEGRGNNRGLTYYYRSDSFSGEPDSVTIHNMYYDYCEEFDPAVGLIMYGGRLTDAGHINGTVSYYRRDTVIDEMVRVDACDLILRKLH